MMKTSSRTKEIEEKVIHPKNKKEKEIRNERVCMDGRSGVDKPWELNAAWWSIPKDGGSWLREWCLGAVVVADESSWELVRSKQSPEASVPEISSEYLKPKRETGVVVWSDKSWRSWPCWWRRRSAPSHIIGSVGTTSWGERENPNQFMEPISNDLS